MSRRIHIPPERIDGAVAHLDRDGIVYLGRVLRLGSGDAVEVFDGEGGLYEGRIEDLDAGRIVLGPRRAAVPDDPPFLLLQGLPKGEKMDWIVRKAVELGVSHVVPVSCRRSVVRLTSERSSRRVERWRRIAREAARQSGRADLPRVDPPRPLDEALALARPEWLRLCPWEGEHERSFRQVVETRRDAPGHAVLIGPEGGLEEAEVEAARTAGFVTVTLGRRILRTETAPLAILAAVRFVQGRLG